jgi:hypothetical protein
MSIARPPGFGSDVRKGNDERQDADPQQRQRMNVL